MNFPPGRVHPAGRELLFEIRPKIRLRIPSVLKRWEETARPFSGNVVRFSLIFGKFVVPTADGHIGPPLRRYRSAMQKYLLYCYQKTPHFFRILALKWQNILNTFFLFSTLIEGRAYVSARQKHYTSPSHIRRIRNPYHIQTHSSTLMQRSQRRIALDREGGNCYA